MSATSKLHHQILNRVREVKTDRRPRALKRAVAMDARVSEVISGLREKINELKTQQIKLRAAIRKHKSRH